ncbi:MAG: hypothetical protein QW199_01480 [Candidatus Pacearchaeota archaeon]
MPLLQDANCRSLEIAFSFFSFFLFCFFSFLLPCTAAININEINCNPENQTYADEYIEIYGYAGLDLENFTICDSNKCNSLIKYKAENSSYSLITTNQSNYKDINASVYFVNSTRIGNGLNNDGDCVYLYYQNFLIDVVCYSGTIQKGNSWQLFSGSWQKCSLSPGSGSENVCESGQGSQGQNRSESQGQEEFSIFYPLAILNKERPFVFVIDAANKSRLYDVKIDITSQDGKRLSEVWNENTGDWQSTYYYVESLNLSNKSFILKIKSNFTGDALAEVKIRDEASYFFQVKVVDYALSGEGGEGGEEGEVSGEGSAESQIKILDLQEAGCESIKVKLRVYRGNTRKYAVYVYAFDKEKGREVSEKSIFYANTKYVNYTLTIPIKLKTITESKSYWIVAEGLDERDEEKIFIQACQSNKTQSSQPSQSSRSESSKSSTSKTEQNKESKRTFYFDTFDVSINDMSFDGNELRINAEIRNRASERNFFVWSYVEQGSACISCKVSKEENAKQISIAENSSVELSLENNLSKTSKTSETSEVAESEQAEFEQAELLVKLGVMPEDETSSELSFVFPIEGSSILPSSSISTSPFTSSEIFESSTVKQGKAASYLLIATFLLVCVLIIFKREII